MARQTLNQIRRGIQRYAEAHGQLFTVKFCQQADLLDDVDIKYPALYFDYTGSRKEKSILIMSFSATVAALAHAEKDNEADIWSDANLIACDLLAFLASDEQDFELMEGVQIKPFSAAGEDGVAGVTFEFSLQVPFPYDHCAAPIRTPNGEEYLITEDGRYILTEDGRKIIIEKETGTLLYSESGTPIITEDGQTLRTE